MPRASLEYERPSRLSQALIAGFSLAVVAMAGWLVLMIMFSHDASTMTAESAAPPPRSPGPPQVENPAPPRPFRVTPSSMSPPQQPSPWDNAPGLASLPSSPVRGSYPPDVPDAPAPGASAYAAPPPAPPRLDYRTAPSELTLREAEPDTAVVPLPRPRRVATIPMPRPRPHLDEDDAAPPPTEKSLLDFLIQRQR